MLLSGTYKVFSETFLEVAGTLVGSPVTLQNDVVLKVSWNLIITFYENYLLLLSELNRNIYLISLLVYSLHLLVTFHERTCCFQTLAITFRKMSSKVHKNKNERKKIP